MLANILELSLPTHRVAMIKELKAVMDTTTNSGWYIGKSIFGEVMGKIEAGKLSWTDDYALWQARVDAKSDVAMGRKWDSSPQPQGTATNHYGSTSNTQAKKQAQMFRKEMPCKNYNWGFCQEHLDHNDVKLPQRYLHMCQFCMHKPDVKDKRHKAKYCTCQSDAQ